MKKSVIIVVIILVAMATILLYGLSRVDDNHGPIYSATPTLAPTPIVSEGGNILVTSPTYNQKIGLPLTVEGEARVFENVLNVRLRDEDGVILIEAFTMADAPDMGQFGPYKFSLSYPSPNGDRGVVEVFSISAKDGSEINKVVIPVEFSDVESSKIKVYFIPNDDRMDCSITESTERRIQKTEAVAKMAAEELLKGPTIIENKKGLSTSINDGVKLNSIKIENGKAYVDFNSILDLNVAGSCRVQAIRSQITDTLKQFATVEDVIISINGATEDILQP